MNSKVGRRMLDTSLPYLKERDQGSAALLEGCLFFFFFSFPSSFEHEKSQRGVRETIQPRQKQTVGSSSVLIFAVPESSAEQSHGYFFVLFPLV